MYIPIQIPQGTFPTIFFHDNTQVVWPKPIQGETHGKAISLFMDNFMGNDQTASVILRFLLLGSGPNCLKVRNSFKYKLMI